MKKRSFHILALAALLLAGCFEKVAYDTVYTLIPKTQAASGDTERIVEGALTYAFAADTAAWFVATYDDALNGVITSRTDPSVKRSDPIATGEPDPTEGLEGSLRMRLTRPSQLVVAIDPEDRLYAYTQQKVAENLPRTYVALTFKPYHAGSSYEEKRWIFRNDFYTPPVYLDCTVVPLKQETEGGETVPFPVSSSAIKAYAFAADTTLWRIASYTDALNGVITSKLDPAQQRQNPESTAYPQTTAYVMSVSHSQLMVVVVDRESAMYAYSQQTVDLTGAPVAFEVTFRPWEQKYLYVEEGWRVVDDTYRPADPDNPDPTNPAGPKPAAKRSVR